MLTRKLTIDRRLRDPEAAIPKEILGNPVGPAVLQRGEAVMQQIVSDVISDLSRYIDGSELVVLKRPI